MPISEVSKFTILYYTWNRKLGNLEMFSFTPSFYRLGCIKHGKGSTFHWISNQQTSCPHASRQIKKEAHIYKETVYKEAPIYACLFLNDVNGFLRGFLKKKGILV